MENVLILTTVSGFLQKFEREDVRLLKEAGHSIVYCANGAEPVYEYEDGCYEKMGVEFISVEIDKSPFRVLKNFKAWRELKKIVIRKNITAIHCHTPVGGLLGRLLGRKFSLKVIYTSHGFHFYEGARALDNLIYKGAESILARSSDAIVVINDEDLKAASAFTLKEGGRVYKIPGAGLDTAWFAPFEDEERLCARESRGLKKNEIFLLCVGELNKNKNHEAVVRAITLLKESGYGNIRLGICGDGPLRGYLEELAVSLGVSENVRLYGYSDNVREFLLAADGFVFPSKREGLGLAALEALSCGIPVIAADNRGSREYMHNGRNGYVCYSNSPDEYAELIKKLISLPEEELRAMKEKGRKDAMAFSKEKTAAVMAQVYGRYLD